MDFPNLEKYVGIPWKINGIDFDGCDCRGIIYLFYKNEYGILLHEFDNIDYKGNRDSLKSLVHQEDYYKNWSEVDNPKLGDVIVIRNFNIPAHLGLVVSKGRMLHAYTDIPSVIESYTSPIWKNKIDGIYRHESRQ